MKKILVLVLMFALSVAIIGCKDDGIEVVDGAEVKLISTESFVVDEVHSYEYLDGELVYIYKHIVGYADDKQTKPIYSLVSSKELHKVGDAFTVATLEFLKGNDKFDFRVVQYANGEYDTSWHKYTEIINE